MTQPTSTGRRARLAAKMALLSVGFATVGVLATSGVSLAHNANAEATCYGIHVTATQFDGPASNNRVTVTVDGADLPPVYFATELNQTFPLVSTVAHTWHVFVEGNILSNPSAPLRFNYGGTVGPCTDTTSSSSTSTSTSTTSTAPGATTTTLPSTSTTAPGGTTTTTLPSTSTTTPGGATTTTLPSTTTTAPGGTTTTTFGGSGGPGGSTTTTAPATPTSTVRPFTTTTAAAALPPSGSGSSGGRAPSAGGGLPVTGSDTGAQLTLAMAVLLAGAGLVTVTRRRPRDVAEES